MDSYAILVVVHLIISAVRLVSGNIDSLNYWETLSISKIQRRIIKRDGHPLQQLIKFNSYGRHFSLVLRKDNSIISPDFKVLVMDADGSETEFQPNINLYRGNVEGEPNSFVSAYLNDDDILSAAFKTSSDFYVIEPAWNLLPNASHDSMIIYRNSDLKWDNNSMCGYIDAEVNTNETFMHHLNFSADNLTKKSDKKAEERSRRATCAEKNSCSLYLVIDPLFYANVGGRDVTGSISYVLSNIDRIDLLYRGHSFEGCGKGFGFVVKKIRVFKETTDGYPYTQIRRYKTTELLSIFAEDPAIRTYCLGHLFTYQSIESSSGYVLGLGYIGYPDVDVNGGICSHSGKTNFNGAWTTFYSYSRLPAMQALLVTAHEMGHNWGSPHDSDGTGCAPSASSGGKYIMYPISVTGSDSNNWLFSPCSRSIMGETLKARSDCFQVKQSSFCGNYLVEKGESCDPGLTSIDADPCCDSNCKFKGSAICSDANSKCCRNCKIIPRDANVVCLRTTQDSCRLDGFCNGKDANCSLGQPKPENTSCYNNGLCRAGECATLCEANKYKDCLCDTEKDACKVCCMNEQSRCLPFASDGKSFKDIAEGMPCSFGACTKNGTCVAFTHGALYRLWQILDLSSPTAFVKFMRNNIVVTIIILSLLLWIPCCCCICYLDRKYDRERTEMIEHLVEDRMRKKKADVKGVVHHDIHVAENRNKPTASGIGSRQQKRSEDEKEKIRAIVKDVEEQPEEEDDDDDDDDEPTEDEENEPKILSASIDREKGTSSVSAYWSKK